MNARSANTDERTAAALLSTIERENASEAAAVTGDLLNRITVTAPLGSATLGAPAAAKASEAAPDVTDEHTAVVIDDGRIEEIAEFQSPEVLYEELIKRVKRYHPSDDISLIEKAYATARELHKDQKRKSGEPYIIHPICVAIILADMEMDKETIAAGILHDVVEDTVMTNEELTEAFGADVALLVDGVTKLSQIQYSSDKLDVQAENLRKMFLAMAKDIRVIMIKLADRLHNMRTLSHMRPEKQQEKARETIDIYAPIAQRLGISKIKVELEDLCLKYLEPEAYQSLAHQIDERKSVREQYVQDIVDEVRKHIKNAGIEARIDGRVKHFFSIYKKMKNQDKTIDQIYDLFAVRIIVASVKDCYAALGVIHEIYKPIPGRFKDYIAVPKENMYQSLHTTLIGQNGVPFEIQIRTFEMHRTAEYGIAAHWKYKEASDGKKPELQEEEKLAWLRQILEWQRDMSDNKEFMNILKSDLDLFSDSVYCFTPTGDVKNLPAGSTPIDFAYSVHSAVGNKMIGARVNGKLVTINYEIKNGDCIEILTSQNSKGPSRDWLALVKSTAARSKINQWFKNEFKEDNILRGKELLNNYCKAKGIDPSTLIKPAYQEVLMRKYGFRDWENLVAAVGHGALKEGQIVNKLLELHEAETKKPPTDADVLAEINKKTENDARVTQPMLPRGRGEGIVVKGISDVAVRFPKCCNPLPGDEIVGFVTRGKGVTIHRTDCNNVLLLPDMERERLVEAEWGVEDEDSDSKYTVGVTLFANNRSGLLADISRTMTEKNIDILSLSTKVSKQGTATLSMSFETAGREEFERIVDKLRQIPDVIEIERNASG
ncbi:MAG: bifunctional (p)ppGpp synthetase/guanosine-3',5'-bis(diphosphate) 3'-pyrophosphohydrolase [Lachnospiraceae bacterium]|nr:bifunctional (p)ppGpp synthetase/guanosine-3',5'-bis(diphosphate) 3'-pyrophosphohydrolase [Lachnospiraceae bacterium]